MPELDGTLGRYVAHALAQSPAVREAYATWQATVHTAAGAGALPEPTIGFTAFLRSVETRVGPQQARVSVQQSLPWPTSLTGQQQAAVAEAQAAQSRFDAVTLATRAHVERRYHALWALRATRDTHRRHLDVLADLAETLRARVEIGAATLADLQQLDLSRARLSDSVQSMSARERSFKASLRAAVGLADAADLPTVDPPAPPAVPSLDADALVQMSLQHPDLQGAMAAVQRAQAEARVAGSQRLPGLTVGADWIVTGPSASPISDSGKDAVMVGLGVQVPLWQGSYARDVAAARSRVHAGEAHAEGLRLAAMSAVHDADVRVRDSARRVQLIQDTLLPQADVTYTALLGSYTVGDATIAQVLLAQRDVLELQVQADEARVAHANAWADLHALCGSEVPRQPLTGDSP